jgi:hypothetical protein
MAVVVAGCTPPGFARLEPFQLDFFPSSLSKSLAMFIYNQGTHGCQTLDQDFSVDMNGEPAFDVKRGGPASELVFGVRCEFPFAELPSPVVFGQTATITATSGGDTVLMEMEGVGTKLDAHPILAPGEVVHAGQLVRLAIDPGFDRVQWRDTALVTMGQYPDTLWEHVPIAPPSAAGVLEVQLPGTMPPGPTNIALLVQAHPVVTRCEGAGSCVVPDTLSVQLDVLVDTVP